MNIHVLSVGDIDIRIHVLTLPVIALCIVFDMFLMLAVSFVSLTLHELCHVLMAKSLKVNVHTIELQPCGFTARIKESSIPIKDELAIALCGPAFSIVCGCVAMSAISFIGFQTHLLMSFALFNIVLGAMNLLPALPLDGGRILKAVLSLFFSPYVCSSICIFTGLILSSTIILSGIYGTYMDIVNFTVPLIGVLILLGTVCEIKHKPHAKLNAMLKRSNAVERIGRLAVTVHAMSASLDVKTAISMFNMNKYNVVDVIDNNLNVIATLDEGTLMTYASNGNSTLKEIVLSEKKRKISRLNDKP